jgi:hypothetical protein
MNVTSFLSAVVPAALLAACSGNVATVGSGSGSGGSSTTSSSAGGAATSSGTSSSSGSTGSSGGGCVSSIDLAVDNAAPKHLTSICAGASWNPTNSAAPIGYGVEGGFTNMFIAQHVLGCVGAAAGSEGIELVTYMAMSPGKYTSGSSTYTDPMGGVWTTIGATSYQVTLTKVGPVGDSIEGTFSDFVGQPMKQQAHPLTGSFHVCHVPDEQVP